MTAILNGCCRDTVAAFLTKTEKYENIEKISEKITFPDTGFLILLLIESEKTTE